MNAITLIWRQVLKELKLFQMKENKEDAVEKTEKELQKTLKCHEDKYTIPLPDTVPPTGKEKETERKQPVRLTQEVRTFLQKQYDFRYNLLTEETEYRPANKRAVPFEPVSKRELNTFCMEAHDQGISCWDKDLSRYIALVFLNTILSGFTWRNCPAGMGQTDWKLWRSVSLTISSG